MLVLKVIHFILAIAVIVGVLMQSGKSAGLSGVVDGGASQFFGKTKGFDEKVSKVTTIVAILFMINSLILAVL